MNGFGTSPLELMACQAMLDGQVFLDEFVYSASWVKGTATELAALSTVRIDIQINGDSDFVAQEQNITTILDDDEDDHTCEPCPNYLLTVKRGGSGRDVMNQPQHIQNIAGNHFQNAYPGHKPMPGLYVMKGTLSLVLQNLTSVVPARVDIAFVGFKVFYTGDQNRKQIFHVL